MPRSLLRGQKRSHKNYERNIVSMQHAAAVIRTYRSISCNEQCYILRLTSYTSWSSASFENNWFRPYGSNKHVCNTINLKHVKKVTIRRKVHRVCILCIMNQTSSNNRKLFFQIFNYTNRPFSLWSKINAENTQLILCKRIPDILQVS